MKWAAEFRAELKTDDTFRFVHQLDRSVVNRNSMNRLGLPPAVRRAAHVQLGERTTRLSTDYDEPGAG
jgi:hypothetical protein